MALMNRSPLLSESKRTGYGYGLILVLLNVMLTAVFWWQLPPQIPLFYSANYGVNQLAAREWFFILPVASVAIWLTFFLVVRWKVQSAIYVNIIKWLHVLCLFLLSLSIIHILLIML